jgi:glyoxylase-like metal-dependent hydrolase (beta-lactamase superfamily II)
VNGVPDGEELRPGVRVLATPGHTMTHGSLIVDDEIALAGDAIVDYSYFRDDSVWNFNADFYGLEAARESIRKLTEPARLIVPGHGMPFWVG